MNSGLEVGGLAADLEGLRVRRPRPDPGDRRPDDPDLGGALRSGSRSCVALAAVPILSLFGAEYVDARSVLLILLVGNVTNALTGPSGFVVSMTGSEWTYAAVMGVHAIGLVVLSFWLGWAYGIVGVALGRSLINVSWNLAAGRDRSPAPRRALLSEAVHVQSVLSWTPSDGMLAAIGA